MKKGITVLFLIAILPYLVLLFYHEKNNNIMVKIKTNEEIKSIPLEEYVIGVVAGEMPASFNIEALKAQAVASRSYVINQIKKNKSYDVTDDALTQVYLNKKELRNKWKKNYNKNIKKIGKAVNDTKGEVLVYDNEVIEALFFSTSSGYTENAEEIFNESRPYLKSVVSTWDAISPVYEEIHYFSKQEFCEIMNINCSDLNIKIIEQTSTGRSKKIMINNIVYDSNEFIKKLNLKSSYLDVNVLNNNVIIKTKGYGHGVGMSQYGALAMALNGSNYREILEYYYQNSEIKKL